MATSGTATFNLDIADLVEEAYERAGMELRSGYDLRTSRRSINLLMIEWQNRGINLWTVNQGSIAMVGGTETYNLPVDTIDLIEYIMRNGVGENQVDYALTRISVSTYAHRTSKNTQSRPTEIYIDRQAVTPTVTFWPIPESADWTFIYWRLKRIEDAGNYDNNMDVPYRFLPPLVSGLAYYMAMKKPETGARMAFLKQQYEEDFRLAAEEDREKASWRIYPYSPVQYG